MSEARPVRADAVRNRRKILKAARERIGSQGSAAGMDDIAQAAGVAVGTLYRHFPTKADLVSAVIAEHVREIADDAEGSLARARSGVRAVDEIGSFLKRAAGAIAHNHAVKVAAEALGVDDPAEHTDEARGAAAVAELIRLGQRAGDVRDGVTVADIYLLMATAPTDQPDAVQQRWLQLVLPGIATRT